MHTRRAGPTVAGRANRSIAGAGGACPCRSRSCSCCAGGTTCCMVAMRGCWSLDANGLPRDQLNILMARLRRGAQLQLAKQCRSAVPFQMHQQTQCRILVRCCC